MLWDFLAPERGAFVICALSGAVIGSPALPIDALSLKRYSIPYRI
jgi:hypothetical protein